MKVTETTQDQSTDDPPLTVYFDGSCPLCSREIAWYRNRAGAESVCWSDVSKVAECNVAEDLKTCDAINRFHVRKSDGTLISGALAFSELWQTIPSLKLAGKITRLPGIRHIAEVVYKIFLYFRAYR